MVCEDCEKATREALGTSYMRGFENGGFASAAKHFWNGAIFGGVGVLVGSVIVRALVLQ